MALNDYRVSLNSKLDHSNLRLFEISICVFYYLLVALMWHCSVSYESVEPILSNEKLVAERVAGGLESPTTFAFIGANDILVLEKNKGTVLRIHNGEVLSEPILDVNVANQVERGMLGIAVSENLPDNKTYVFLLYTEAEGETARGGSRGKRIKATMGIENKPIVETVVNLQGTVSTDMNCLMTAPSF